MRSSRRRELFPPDRGLQVRMAAAFFVGVLLTAVLVAGMVWVAVAVNHGWVLTMLMVGSLVGGVQASYAKPRDPDWDDPEVRRRRWARRLRPHAQATAERRRIEPLVQRVCMVADLPMPSVEIERSDAPLSWTTAFPTRSPTLHVTTGLMQKVTDDQLSVVVAHEVSHIAQRDVWLMTVVGAVPTWITLGNRRAEQRAIEEKGEDSFSHGAHIVFGYLASALVGPGLVASRIFSRYRELSADRGAAALTGSPSAVAATLLALSRALERIPSADLRTLAARDPFHLLPVGPEQSGLRRLWATHPPLSQRLEQLERMEEALHAARPRPPRGP